ncbi:hypothetical protein BaRGS_00029707 [Batillaria attramentaria]|uniref:Ig-like domain-containing protein n=1 Tax=Batillaria attramentaria TaxID=370345 RepID=A0ABD0JVM5_9CAEN
MAVLAGHRDRYSLSVICVFLALTSSAAAVYVQGNINTTEDWVYIAQFCYLSSGNLDYELLYPKAFGVEKLLLYYDDIFTNATSGSQNCTERVSFLSYEFNTIIDLSERSFRSRFAGCNVTRIDGDEYYKCEEHIGIRASRPRMWYVALARCELSEEGICHSDGPSGSNVKVTGPSSFLTNGVKRMTLTCETGEVNPVPKFKWKGAVCENGNEDSKCTFSPHPHDDNPPLKPPQLSGYNTTSKIVKPDDSPKCTVEGGKPLVTSVVYSCSNDTLPDEQDVRTEIFVSSSLTLDSSSVQETEVVCKCVAVWDPQPDLYSLSQEDTIYLQMSSEEIPNEHDRQLNSETPSQSAVGANVAPVTVMFLLPPSIEENDAASDKDDDDAHVLNIKMDPGYVSAEDLDIPDVVSSGSESLGPEIHVTPCFTGETSDYAVVGEMTPSQKCVSIKRDPGSGYSEVQIHDPTARADTTGPSAKPCDAAEPPLTNTCDQPVTPVPNCHADNHQFSLERREDSQALRRTVIYRMEQFLLVSVSAEVPPTAVCQPFVTEGDDFTCEYGPSESGVTVSGPASFPADGKKNITLTCTAVDVNPEPIFSWQDPPPVPPKLSGYNKGKPLQPGDSPKCTVTGGKPLVSSVNFSCSEDVCPDQPDIVQDNSVISPLVNASERNTTNKLRCRCTAHWDVEPTLYALTAEDTLEVEASGEQNPHGSDQDGTNGESSAAVAGGTVSAVVAIIVVVVIVVIIVKRKRVKLQKVGTYDDVEDNLPMRPPIGDCRDTNDGEKSEIQVDSGYSTPLDQISGSSSDGSMKKPCPAKWRVVGSGDYSLVEESGAGIGQSPLRVLTKDKHGYSDVEVLGPSPPIDSASATPFEVVNVTPTGASPLGAVPGRKDGFNRQFSSDVHQVRGPDGDFYAQVHKVPKGVSGLPTTGGNAAKMEGKNPEGASEVPPTANKQEKTQAEGDDDGTYDKLHHHGSHPAPHAPEQVYSHINE